MFATSLITVYYIDMLYIDVPISDNALLTQSRFVLMESILMHFSLLGLLCIVKFRKVMDQPTSVSWWIWLILGIVNLTCALWYNYSLSFFFHLLNLFSIEYN